MERDRKQQKLVERWTGKKLEAQANIAGASLEEAQGTYQQFLLGCQVAESSDYYYFTLSPATPDPARPVPAIPRTAFSWFYNDIIAETDRFTETYKDLLKDGRKLTAATPGQESGNTSTQELLRHCYTLVENFIIFNEASTSRPRGLSQLPGPKQQAIGEFITSIGSQKPECVRETLRRYIPRFLTYPIQYESGDVPGGLTAKDADYLADPADIAEGRVPLHLGFKIADRHEAEGNIDLAYQMKINGILAILQMEAEFFDSHGPEIPFFTHILPGLIAGKNLRSSNQPYFDFRSEVGKLLETTYIRLEEELQRQTPGMAAQFLTALSEIYPGSFANRIARSIIDCGQQNNEFDDIALLRTLPHVHTGWASGVLRETAAVPDRKMIHAQEFADFADRVLVSRPEAEINPDQFVETVRQVAGDEDIFNFKLPLPLLGFQILGKKTSASVTIELDSTAEEIKVQIAYQSPELTRHAPFTLSFSGEIESLQADVIETDGINANTAARYRELVIKALNYQASKIKRETPSESVEPTSGLTMIPYQVETLSREERMRFYQAQRDRAERKRKKTKTGPSAVPITGIPHHFLIEPVPSAQSSREIVGIEPETVAEMLTAGNIQNVSADTVIAKLLHLVEVADVGNKMIGKKVETTQYRRDLGDIVDDINLRQINWTEGGSNAMRVYLQDVGSGQFVLRGIILKKGSNQQTREIRKILAKILKAQ